MRVLSNVTVNVRTAAAIDASACRDIYAPYVTDSAVSFELQVPSVAEMARRIAAANAEHSWIVAELDSRVIGYAYGTSHRSRRAYHYSVETSVYVDPAAQGKGLGGRLYDELFNRLVRLGYFHAYAGIALPNDASIALHRAAGFEFIGTFPKVGHKFDTWHDVSWWYRALQSGVPNSG